MEATEEVQADASVLLDDLQVADRLHRSQTIDGIREQIQFALVHLKRAHGLRRSQEVKKASGFHLLVHFDRLDVREKAKEVVWQAAEELADQTRIVQMSLERYGDAGEL